MVLFGQEHYPSKGSRPFLQVLQVYVPGKAKPQFEGGADNIYIFIYNNNRNIKIIICLP